MKKRLYYPEKAELVIKFDKYLKKIDYKHRLSKFFVNLEKPILIQDYQYIEGRILDTCSKEDYLNGIDYIKFLSYHKKRPRVERKNIEFSLLNEILRYEQMIKDRKSFYLDQEWQNAFLSLSQTFDHFKVVRKWTFNEQYISHGDLHFGNIIVDKVNRLNLIDFEEVCFAPIEFDLTIYIYRFMNISPGKLDKVSLTRIILEFEKNNLEIKDVLLYIIKVIYQKKYLEITKKTSVSEWEKDSWTYWFDDFKLIKEWCLENGKNINYS